MNIWAKVGIFSVFLIVYGLWAFLSFKLLYIFLDRILRQKGYILMRELLSLLGFISLFLFTWILTGFFDVTFVLLLLAGELLALLVLGILWGLVGSPRSRWGAQILWDGSQNTLRYPWSGYVSSALGLIMLIGYPVAAGWIYFTKTVPSMENTIRIFQVTIVMMFFLGLVETLKSTVMILISPSLLEEARSRILANKITDFVTYGLMASMFLWAFGIATQGHQVSLGAIPLHFSPTVVALLCAFLILGYLAPYLIGVHRGKGLRASLIKQRSQLLQSLLDVINNPEPIESKQGTLEKLQQDITADITSLVQEFPGLQLAIEIENLDAETPLPPQQEMVRTSYELCRDDDPRIRHITYLDQLRQEAGSLKDRLGGAEGGKEPNELLGQYKNHYQGQLERIKETAEDIHTSNPKLFVGICMIGGPVITPILSELGKWIWNLISTSATG